MRFACVVPFQADADSAAAAAARRKRDAAAAKADAKRRAVAIAAALAGDMGGGASLLPPQIQPARQPARSTGGDDDDDAAAAGKVGWRTTVVAAGTLALVPADAAAVDALRRRAAHRRHHGGHGGSGDATDAAVWSGRKSAHVFAYARQAGQQRFHGDLTASPLARAGRAHLRDLDSDGGGGLALPAWPSPDPARLLYFGRGCGTAGALAGKRGAKVAWVRLRSQDGAGGGGGCSGSGGGGGGGGSGAEVPRVWPSEASADPAANVAEREGASASARRPHPMRRRLVLTTSPAGIDEPSGGAFPRDVAVHESSLRQQSSYRPRRF